MPHPASPITAIRYGLISEASKSSTALEKAVHNHLADQGVFDPESFARFVHPLDMRYSGMGQMAFRQARWRRADRKAVLNCDLWEQLLKLSESWEINWQWVRSHTGNPLNEEVDTMAWHAALTAAVHRNT